MERRLAAILAADMVGYSRLMAADETAVLTRQKQHRREVIDPKIREYRGRIVKTTGDGLLAEFPSVVDAMRCAVGIQMEVTEREAAIALERRIAYRIGINLGDIVIDEGDIYGDGVNIAARLEAMADPGGILVSETVVDHVRTKVVSRFEDLGERQLKNLPAARVYRVLMQPEQPGEGATVALARFISARMAVAALAVLAILGTAAGLLIYTAGGGTGEAGLTPVVGSTGKAAVDSDILPPNGNEKASIAVLPFQNMSPEPDQEYFADGITEDIITSLAKYPELLVISRNSTFRLKSQGGDPRKIASDLSVLYILTGSVRRGGNDVRINAQLVEAESGGSVWAERYDGELSNVLALQSAVADQIADALALNLAPNAAAEQRQGETENPDAYDLLLRGWEHYRKRTPEQLVRALEYFQEAIALDPDYARAHAAAAAIYWTSFFNQWVGSIIPDEPDLYRRRDKAYEHLARAINDPTTLALQVQAKIDLYRGRYDESLSNANEAIRLDHNDADALTTFAEVLILLGRPEDAYEPIRKAERLDPYNRSYHLYLLGIASFGQSEFEEAASYLERALELGPQEWSFGTSTGAQLRLYAMLAASYAYLKRSKATQDTIDDIKAIWNSANVATELYFWLYKEEEDRHRLADGLRLAGFPEF